MVLVPIPQIGGHRGDLHEVGAIPGPAERDRRLVEEHVDVGRDERLPRPALLGLCDESHDRGVLLRERVLARRVGERRRYDDERAECDQCEKDRSA